MYEIWSLSVLLIWWNDVEIRFSVVLNSSISCSRESKELSRKIRSGEIISEQRKSAKRVKRFVRFVAQFTTSRVPNSRRDDRRKVSETLVWDRRFDSPPPAFTIQTNAKYVEARKENWKRRVPLTLISSQVSATSSSSQWFINSSTNPDEIQRSAALGWRSVVGIEKKESKEVRGSRRGDVARNFPAGYACQLLQREAGKCLHVADQGRPIIAYQRCFNPLLVQLTSRRYAKRLY